MADPSLIDSIKEGTVEQNERLTKALSWLCTGGRLTDHEYQMIKSLAPFPVQRWEWDEKVSMWKHRDFADVEQIAKLASTLEDQARLIGECREALEECRKIVIMAEAVKPMPRNLGMIDALLTKLNAFGRAR